MAKNKQACPKGFDEITPSENATMLVALHNWENTLDLAAGKIPRPLESIGHVTIKGKCAADIKKVASESINIFDDFFDADAGGAKGIPNDKISDFAEKLNTSLVCIKK